ncbi:hypothetical protein BN1723_001080 [Verticillium longisporum]|uniref:Uncharacterized protein n=1 Tax=Verticillium longisporum TaxID=100787 RepID=A0A0G4NH01_VERLO|nr:hypothetical protein BN1723_001080 [Verticillium longisporum]
MYTHAAGLASNLPSTLDIDIDQARCRPISTRPQTKPLSSKPQHTNQARLSNKPNHSFCLLAQRSADRRSHPCDPSTIPQFHPLEPLVRYFYPPRQPIRLDRLLPARLQQQPLPDTAPQRTYYCHIKKARRRLFGFGAATTQSEPPKTRTRSTTRACRQPCPISPRFDIRPTARPASTLASVPLPPSVPVTRFTSLALVDSSLVYSSSLASCHERQFCTFATSPQAASQRESPFLVHPASSRSPSVVVAHHVRPALSAFLHRHLRRPTSTSILELTRCLYSSLNRIGSRIAPARP